MSVDSMPVREVRAKVDAYDRTLLATDARFRRHVSVIHEDGSVLYFDSAFLMRVGEPWLAIFTEHHGCHVYHVEDLVSYSQLEPVYAVDDIHDVSV